LTIPIPRCIDAMTVVHATPLEDPVSDKVNSNIYWLRSCNLLFCTLAIQDAPNYFPLQL
jgi:hypothetical protein